MGETSQYMVNNGSIESCSTPKIDRYVRKNDLSLNPILNFN
jgi:hypothetical protein